MRAHGEIAVTASASIRRMVCPDCKSWRALRRGIDCFQWHRSDARITRTAKRAACVARRPRKPQKASQPQSGEIPDASPRERFYSFGL